MDFQDIQEKEIGTAMMQSLGETAVLPQTYGARRDGESARNHELYKNATAGPDGLYHCPWEGDASCNHKPEKLKCNYDKFVDSHLKPYRCKFDACEGAQFSSTACLLRHEREAHGLHGHGEKPFLCAYEGCERGVPGNGFPRQWNLKDHMKRVHNDHGSSSGSPPAATTTAAPSKGRKRKNDTSDAPAPTSRKNSQKSAPVKEEAKDTTKPLMDEWYEHHFAIQEAFRVVVRPTDENMPHLMKMQQHLSALAKLSTTLSGLPAYGSTG